MSSMAHEIIESLLTAVGGKYSRELGIDLTGADQAEISRWFLAAKLFGARISTDTAIRTFREFEKCGVVTPKRILATGWDGLVSILDAGGYVRYDFSTATRLLSIMEALTRSFDGDLNALHEVARDSADLECLIKGLGTGIGDVTVTIFLRELRTVWPKARPALSPPALLASGHLDLVVPGLEPLAALESLWSRYPVTGRDFCDFEAALVRLGKDYCRKERHDLCPLRDFCGKGNLGWEQSGGGRRGGDL